MNYYYSIGYLSGFIHYYKYDGHNWYEYIPDKKLWERCPYKSDDEQFIIDQVGLIKITEEDLFLDIL